MLQDRAPAASLTTVLAARSAVLLTASPLGAAPGGFLVDRTSAPAVLTGCGGLMILIAVISAVVLEARLPSRQRFSKIRGCEILERPRREQHALRVADLAALHTACLDEALPDDGKVNAVDASAWRAATPSARRSPACHGSRRS